jgi:hypothetical protein
MTAKGDRLIADALDAQLQAERGDEGADRDDDDPDGVAAGVLAPGWLIAR